MKNTLFKKGLVVGIIILFVGISVLSSVSSKEVSVSNKGFQELEKISVDNPVTSLTDNYLEIFSKIEACVWDPLGIIIGRNWLFSVLYIPLGQSWPQYIIIDGIRFSRFGFSVEYFKVKAREVYAERVFWGWGHWTGPDSCEVGYRAFGNIEWSTDY